MRGGEIVFWGREGLKRLELTHALTAIIMKDFMQREYH